MPKACALALLILGANGCAEPLSPPAFVSPPNEPAELSISDPQVQSGEMGIPTAASLTYLRSSGVTASASASAAEAELAGIEVLTNCHFDEEHLISYDIISGCEENLVKKNLAVRFIETFDRSPLSKIASKPGRPISDAKKIYDFINAHSEYYYFAGDVLDKVNNLGLPSVPASIVSNDPEFWAEFQSSSYLKKMEIAAVRLPDLLNEPNTKIAKAELPMLVSLVVAYLSTARKILYDAQSSRERAINYTTWLKSHFLYYQILANITIMRQSTDPITTPMFIIRRPKAPMVTPTSPQLFELVIHKSPMSTVSIPLSIRESSAVGSRISFQLESAPQQAITPLNFSDTIKKWDVEIRWYQVDVLDQGSSPL